MDEFATPAMVIDAAAVQRNVERLASYANARICRDEVRPSSTKMA